MKRLLLFFAFLTMAGVAHAGDPTTDLLNAPRVNDFITLSVGPGNDGKAIVKYTIDTNNSPRMVNGLTFRSNSEIAIHIQNLNPLTQAWVVETKATPDVSFAAIKAFLDDLKTLQASLPQAQTEAQANAQAAKAAPAARGARKEDCGTLNSLIQETYTALQDPGLTAEKLQEFVTEAIGHKGVVTAEKDFVGAQQSIQKSIATARRKLGDLRAAYGSLGNDPSKTCSVVSGQILVDYIEVRSTADQIIAAKEALSQQIGELVKILQPFLDQNVWYGNVLTDYVIKTVTPSFAEQQSVSVTTKLRTVQLKGGSIVVSTDDANVIAGTFVVRKNSFFVAERAAAMIYNNLNYPQYGTTKTANGDTVVQRTKDHQPINGALMLNLVMRVGRDSSVAYPFLQFGVSSAKDFPGFLAGLGIRFADPFNFSISAGGMITRYKDLDGSLKVGDVVSGTDDINKHLAYKTSPVVLYGAVQLKF